jgi:hypothetical protein
LFGGKPVKGYLLYFLIQHYQSLCTKCRVVKLRDLPSSSLLMITFLLELICLCSFASNLFWSDLHVATIAHWCSTHSREWLLLRRVSNLAIVPGLTVHRIVLFNTTVLCKCLLCHLYRQTNLGIHSNLSLAVTQGTKN